MKGKKVTVTGGAGFLGKYVVKRLEALGANVFVPRRDEYNFTYDDDVHSVLYDQPDTMIHLAAQCGGIGANMANPATYFYDNLMMGTKLLHRAWQMEIKKFVAVGTVCAYPENTPVPFKEEDLWNGYPEPTNAPYGLAKKMLLVQSQAYRQQYDFNSCVLFPANLYGPGDNYDLNTSHVIPAMIRKFIEAKRRGHSVVRLWGDGSPTREFLYVDDCAEAIVRAAECYNSSEPMNIGTGEEVSIMKLAETIAALVEYRGDIVWDDRRPNGQPRRRLSIARAMAKMDWKAKTPLLDGLRETIEAYKCAH